ncbi:MAG: hypothetical protein AB7P49_10580 [Bdellovibrionales bacterium]
MRPLTTNYRRRPAQDLSDRAGLEPYWRRYYSEGDEVSAGLIGRVILRRESEANFRKEHDDDTYRDCR